MATETLRPIGVGDRTDILHQYPASDAHWDKVNEVVADEDARYVFHNADLGDPLVMTGDLYALEDSAIGAGTINSVTVTVRGRGVGPDSQWIQTYIKTVATEYTGTQTALTTSYADYSTVYTTNPNTGAAWTWAQINALQAAGRICASAGGDGREARKTQVWVVVDCTVTSQTLYPSSIVQSISIGTPSLLYPQTLLPSSIVQSTAYGTPVLLNPQTLLPSSIIQAIAYGTSIVTRPQRYEFYLDESAYYNVYGAYWRSQTFTPQSLHKITSVKLKLCRVGSPGTGTVSIKATDVNGKPTGADLCSGSIDGNSLPTDPTLLGFSLGAGATLSVGTKYAIVWRFPSGDASNYARTRHMYTGTYTGGTAVTSSNSGATWDVVTDWDFVFEDWGESLVQTVAPESTVQPVTYGSPIVYFYGTIYPESIVQPIAYGVPTILGGIPSGIIWPESIIQPISVGSPTILKYVWHVVLDGNYITATPPTNRAFVIGRDVYGNPVYGTAVDSTELGLVGERLDFQQELAVPTEALANSVAQALLQKMRLTTKRGVILIPPNCGQELFDVVQLSDKGANQEAVKFRVVGIRFEYKPKQARYQHNLILGAP